MINQTILTKYVIDQAIMNYGPELKKFEDYFTKISSKVGQACNFTNTTSLPDVKMLAILNKLFSPKTILEIGTFVGMTTHTLAYSSIDDATVHTVDYGNNFVHIECPHLRKIKLNSNISSTSYLTNTTLVNIDMVFVDANINVNDIRLLYPKLSNQFVYAVHDYYDSNGMPQKGFEAISIMVNELVSRGNFKFSMLIPDKTWYFTGTSSYNANGCVGFIVAEK